MSQHDLASVYRAYIDCLNARAWGELSRFVCDDVRHNERPFGIAGYRAMLEEDVRQIPDLQFAIRLLVCEPPDVAARLWFDCRPAGAFLGLPVNSRRVAFAEHVFYRFEGDRIRQVWSLLDTAALAMQIQASS